MNMHFCHLQAFYKHECTSALSLTTYRKIIVIRAVYSILLYAMPSQRVLIRMIYQKESRVLVWVFIRIKFSPVPR